MPLDTIVNALKKTPLFQSLQPSQVKNIAQLAEKVLFKPGDMIIEEGAVGDSAILLVSGTAVRVSGPDTGPHGQQIGEGSMIGEMAMLVESVHSSTIMARSPVKALRINRSDLLEHMLVDRNLADHLVHVLVGRLANLAEELRTVEATLTQPFAPPLLTSTSATRGGGDAGSHASAH